MRSREEVIAAFRPVEKLDSVRQMKMMHIQKEMEDTALAIMDYVPDCADRTAALRKLLECKQTCVQAITHHKETGNVQASQKADTEIAPSKESKEADKNQTEKK